MQDLLLALRSEHCKSLVIYGVDVFCRVFCIDLLINADILQAKTAEIEKRLMFLLLFLAFIAC